MKQRSQIPLTALRAFEAAARRCRLQSACDELLLAPGAVSQQMRSLEQRSKCSCSSGPGRYELTPLGNSRRVVLPAASTIRNWWSEILRRRAIPIALA